MDARPQVPNARMTVDELPSGWCNYTLGRLKVVGRFNLYWIVSAFLLLDREINRKIGWSEMGTEAERPA